MSFDPTPDDDEGTGEPRPALFHLGPVGMLIYNVLGVLVGLALVGGVFYALLALTLRAIK